MCFNVIPTHTNFSITTIKQEPELSVIYILGKQLITMKEKFIVFN